MFLPEDQAERALLRLFKAEVEASPVSHENTTVDQDVLVEAPIGRLASVLEQLRQKGGQRAESIENGDQEEESCIKENLDSKLESVSCLKYWEKFDLEFGSHRVKEALCRLARFVLVFCRNKLLIICIQEISDCSTKLNRCGKIVLSSWSDSSSQQGQIVSQG